MAMIVPLHHCMNCLTDNMALFNARYGDSEAFLRSKIDQLISPAEFSSFGQLQSFSELMTALSSTHIGEAVQDIKESNIQNLRRNLAELLNKDLSDIQADSESGIYNFIDFIRHKYMIENIFLILMRAVQSRQDSQQIRFNPIGMCEQLQTLVNTADSSIFKAVLESTPVSSYFQDADVDVDFFQQVQSKIDDKEQRNTFIQELEICKQKVLKQYYKKFIEYNRSCGGNTWEAMRKVLSYEMDVMAIMLRLNMLKSSNNNIEELYPLFGDLYPFVQDTLTQAQDYDSVMNALNDYPEYKEVLDQAASGEKSVLEIFKQKKVAYLEECIKVQFNFGCIYAWLQLREMENENIFLMVQGNVMNQQDLVRQQMKK